MNTSKERPITAHLRIKDNRYYATFNYRRKDGQTKTIWRATGLEVKPGNKRRAQNKMEEMRYQLRGVFDVPGYDILFVDYLRDWSAKKQGKVAESTYSSVRGCVDRTICRYFEPMNLSLSEVKPKHIKHLYEHLYKNGRADGKGGLSISTIKSVKSILMEAFKMAIIDGLIMNNPVESVKLPAKDNPRKPYTVLTQDSANQLLGYVIHDDLMYPLLLITLRYGLRRSEVLGLKWSAIDFQRNVLRIESTITSGKNPERNKTKTETSKASFPILPDIREALMMRKQAQDRCREAYGDAYVETDYIFTQEKGRYLNPDWVTETFKEILASCGLPDMRFHELRHSTACILHSNGMGLKELQKWMRHGKMEMTADVYLHISQEREKQLAAGLQDMLSASAKGQDDVLIKKHYMA